MVQAMNAQEAREMLKASQQKPNLVTQVVPSPITFTWDATIQGIIKEGKLGELIYAEVHQHMHTKLASSQAFTAMVSKRLNVKQKQQKQQQAASSGSVIVGQH